MTLWNIISTISNKDHSLHAMKLLFKLIARDLWSLWTYVIEEWPIDDSGACSSSLPSKEVIGVVAGSYSSVLNNGENYTSSNLVLSPFLISVVNCLNERSKYKTYHIDAEFKNIARGRNPATDFAIVVCIYNTMYMYYILLFFIWWYVLYFRDGY